MKDPTPKGRSKLLVSPDLLHNQNSPFNQSAPAKLNLFLHIVGQAPNGFHTLESFIVFLELHDFISLEKADCLQLNRQGPFAKMVDVPPDEDIIVQTARRLAKLAGVEPKVRISLTKNIPVSAGLGGGSADAAATLNLLCQFWGIKGKEVELERLALTLGTDVPVCLYGADAIVKGIGEIIIPASLPKVQIPTVLINPMRALSTKSVFKHFKGKFMDKGETCPNLDNLESFLDYFSDKDNSLTQAAKSLCADVKYVLTSLQTSPGCRISRLSGSGPTCFGLFTSEAKANEAAEKIASDRPDWWVVSTAILKKTAPTFIF